MNDATIENIKRVKAFEADLMDLLSRYRMGIENRSIVQDAEDSFSGIIHVHYNILVMPEKAD